MKPSRTRGLILGLALVLGLTGCASAAQTANAPIERAEVLMPPSYRFDPVAIQVPVGTTVTWRNTDNFSHAVSVAGGTVPILDLRPGQSGTITFDQPGTYAYVCTYHAQDMQGTVSVVER
ncbi:MAG TPA: plastocyanin/azurin family copper-binding protein [Herpetosiphonaceae bacterium]